MGIFDSSVPFKDQNYSKLKKECTSSGKLFTDDVFPPAAKSLFFSKSAPADIVWKRPGEIVSNPTFINEGASADDFSQGSLGNCWFVAACACIADKKSLLKKIVPDIDEQEWSKDNKYAGIFHFRFWQCGEWVDVVIDDYLPTRNGKLIFVHSDTRNEFWSALLEKAYAKLFGDYESLTAGKAKDAMVDMTGGVGEGIELSDYKQTEESKMKLFKILHKSISNKALMSASISASANDMEAVLDCGLVKGHAYSVTAVKDIKLGKGLIAFFKREKIHMVRCRNPWGGTEWMGAWSDGSPEWERVSESEKKDLGLTFDENGEFWMSFDDFCTYFTSMDICHVINTSLFSFSKTWKEGKANGEWKGRMSGGCGNFETFLHNPQYIFDITDEEDEILVSLEQYDQRKEKDSGKSNYTIGFTIIQADLNRKYRMHDKLKHIHSGPFTNARNVFARVTLKQGRYLIIPSTFDPGFYGNYLLRMYCSNAPNMEELWFDEPPPPQCCTIFRSAVQAATQITIVKGESLADLDFFSKSDPYFEIVCEGKKVTSQVCKNTVNPEWNQRVTFYQKKPKKDITIEVWNNNMIKDEFMGICTIPMADSNRRTYQGGNSIKRYNLYGKGKEAKIRKQGFIWLKILHSRDMEKV